jgi:hypothetical protein
MNLVVCRIHPSIHAAYQDHKEEIETSIASVDNKLNGIETQTSRALVRDTAKAMGEAVHALKGARTPWLAGYPIKVLDGNCIEATHHRIAPLRGIGAGALPGKSLVIDEPQLEMATDVFPCENSHTQERALLGAVLPTLEPGDVLIMDRNFWALIISSAKTLGETRALRTPQLSNQRVTPYHPLLRRAGWPE